MTAASLAATVATRIASAVPGAERIGADLLPSCYQLRRSFDIPALRTMIGHRPSVILVNWGYRFWFTATSLLLDSGGRDFGRHSGWPAQAGHFPRTTRRRR